MKITSLKIFFGDVIAGSKKDLNIRIMQIPFRAILESNVSTKVITTSH